MPLIIAAPGMKKNIKTECFAEYVDIYPTLLDMCGFEITSKLHGKSLMSVLKEPSVNVQEQAFSVCPSYRASRTDSIQSILGYSVRTKDFRYTEWIRISTGELQDRELYDYRADSQGNNNVADDEKYIAELPKLAGAISNFREKYGN